MNINIFFLMIATGLLMILLFFKPLDLKKQDFVDVPLFELNNFTLYELQEEGLTTLMHGEKTTRFSDRYRVDMIDFTDNSKKLIVNMKANEGLYKDDVVSLKGDVEASREDGIVFQTQEANYNSKTKILYSDVAYKAYRETDKMTGNSFSYDNLNKKASSKNVEAVYNLIETK